MLDERCRRAQRRVARARSDIRLVARGAGRGVGGSRGVGWVAWDAWRGWVAWRGVRRPGRQPRRALGRGCGARERMQVGLRRTRPRERVHDALHLRLRVEAEVLREVDVRDGL